MQPLAGIANERGQPFLDVRMNVFELARPGKFAALDFGEHRLHPAFDGGHVVRAQDSHAGEHARVRERALDVDGSETAVEVHRRGIALDEVRNRLGESPRPAAGAGAGAGNGFGN